MLLLMGKIDKAYLVRNFFTLPEQRLSPCFQTWSLAHSQTRACLLRFSDLKYPHLVPRGRVPFGQHRKSRNLAWSNIGSPPFTDFPSLCACSESSLTNLIGSGLNLLCLQSHSKPECRWTWPEVAILGADQKESGLWRREWNTHLEQQASA